jgi:hypothetical protein
MTDDRYSRVLEELDSSRRSLSSELDTLGSIILAAIEQRRAGLRVSDVPEAIRLIAHREGTLAALSMFGIAFAAARAEGVRVLVDEEQRTLADVARLMNLSRQVVSRIYNERARSTP